MASTKLSLPYYLTNTPLIRLSNSINEGVIVNKENNLTGEKIKFDDTYMNINEDTTNKANSLIYINNSSQFGSLALPIRNEDKNESFILTSKTNNEEEGQGGWKWTNILDLPLTKYLTVNINNKIDNNKILINNANNELFFNSNYNYIGIFDLYIKINPIVVSNYIKNNIGLCLVITNTESIYDIIDITTTTNSYINKVKIINNIISPTNSSSIITLEYTCKKISNYDIIFANENINLIQLSNNDISSLGLEIYGTLTIFEFKK